MSTQRSLIRRLLRPLQPRDCFVVADVTRTILHQRPGGFSRQMRSLIAAYVDAGGILCAVTGDSRDTIAEYFLEPLAYRGAGTFFVITGAGSRIDAVRRNSIKRLYQGPVVGKQARSELLDAMEDVLRLEFETDFAFSAGQRRQLLASRGKRIDISRSFGLPEPLYVEIRPEKGATLFLEGPSEYGGHKASLLARFAEHVQVRATALAEGLRVSRGGDYTDLITATKYEGLASFFRLKESAQLGLSNRVVIAIGDSPNDEGLFTYPYATDREVINVFVGNDQAFFKRVQHQSAASQGIQLTGEFTKGTEYVLSQLCDGT